MHEPSGCRAGSDGTASESSRGSHTDTPAGVMERRWYLELCHEDPKTHDASRRKTPGPRVGGFPGESVASAEWEKEYEGSGG